MKARGSGSASSDWSHTRSKLFVVFGLFGLLLVFALAYILGQTSQDKTQRNLEEKLVLVRQKVATCTQQREQLRIKNKKAGSDPKSPSSKLRKENDELAEENNQLMEDNESLREEKTVLEETISELRYELDMKDVVNDEEKRQLLELRQMGNLSSPFLQFLDEQERGATLDKDSVITKLIGELKGQKARLQTCHAGGGAASAPNVQPITTLPPTAPAPAAGVAAPATGPPAPGAAGPQRVQR